MSRQHATATRSPFPPRAVVKSLLLLFMLAFSSDLARADAAFGDSSQELDALPIALPKCAPHEGLCPVKRGSNQLRVSGCFCVIDVARLNSLAAVRRLHRPQDMRRLCL